VRNRAVSREKPPSLSPTPSHRRPGSAPSSRLEPAGRTISASSTPRPVRSLARRLGGMARRAQALAVVVGVLPASPKRDRVVKLERPGRARRYVDQLAAAGAVWAIPQPDPQAGLLPASATVTACCPDARRLANLPCRCHLNPWLHRSDSRTRAHLQPLVFVYPFGLPRGRGMPFSVAPVLAPTAQGTRSPRRQTSRA